jgi:putative flippase GtrA
MLICGVCSSQSDPEYVRKFPEKFTVRLGMQSTFNSFSLTNAADNSILEILPNDKTYLGASFLFRSVELDLGFAPNFLAENQDNEGSRLFTLNFRMFLGKWMQTLDFYSQKGFFATDGNNTLPIPEMTSLKIGGTTGYIFNDRFSFRAIGFQNEWQKKSAGSFIPRFTFYYTKLDLHDESPESSTKYYDIAVGPGYYYNWVIKRHFIFSLGATLGFGVNLTSSDFNTQTTSLTQVIFRTAIGYNSERFFMGLNASAQLLQHKTDPTILQDDIITFGEFYLGYRFNAPKSWIEKADKFNRKFGLD